MSILYLKLFVINKFYHTRIIDVLENLPSGVVASLDAVLNFYGNLFWTELLYCLTNLKDYFLDLGDLFFFVVFIPFRLQSYVHLPGSSPVEQGRS